MNAELTDNLRAAILTVPVAEWRKFFKDAKDKEYATLSGTPDSELTNIKYRVIIIDELENLFTTARQQPSTTDIYENDSV